MDAPSLPVQLAPSAWWPTSGLASLVMIGFLGFAYVVGMWTDMQSEVVREREEKWRAERRGERLRGCDFANQGRYSPELTGGRAQKF